MPVGGRRDDAADRTFVDRIALRANDSLTTTTGADAGVSNAVEARGRPPSPRPSASK